MHLALFATLAMVLLMIAGFNYVNLATARAQGRIHEIGVRKALGAHRGQIIRQLLSESVLMSVGATFLGVAMAEIVTPFLPALGGIDFEWSPRWTVSTCAGTAALAVAVGLAAGAYPAWVVARFQPAVLERGGRIGGVRLRRGLVVAQFTVTATLMTMTLLIWHQVSFIQSMLRENSRPGVGAGTGCHRQEPLERRPDRRPGPDSQSRVASRQPYRRRESLQGSTWSGLGHVKSWVGGTEIVRTEYEVDSDFVEVLGLRMVQGRFLTDEPADAKRSSSMRPSCAGWAWKSPLERPSAPWDADERVVGVIEDFHFEGPRAARLNHWSWHKSPRGWESSSCGCNPATSKKPSK